MTATDGLRHVRLVVDLYVVPDSSRIEDVSMPLARLIAADPCIFGTAWNVTYDLEAQP